MSTGTAQGGPRPGGGGETVLPAASLLAKGLAALRIFFGLIFLVNGLAKLFEIGDVTIGSYKAILIDRGLTRSILENEGERTGFPLVGWIAEDVILANWSVFQWLITAFEIGIGALLVAGLATRLAALAGLGQQLFLAALYFSSSRWLFEQPHEYVPLVILAIVPAGRVWGLDGLLLRRGVLERWPPRLRSWPF